MSNLDFTALSCSITESTVWMEPDSTRIAWITMLAMSDGQGRVLASVPGLANRARIPVDAARTAIASFLAPDMDSRTTDFEGRRIEAIDGGWRLLNYGKHQSLMKEEGRKERNRKSQERFREKNSKQSSAIVSDSKQSSAIVSDSKQSSAIVSDSKQSSAQQNMGNAGKPEQIDPSGLPLPSSIELDDWKSWIAYRRSRKLTLNTQTLGKQIEFLAQCHANGQSPGDIINTSITKGWQGLFESKASVSQVGLSVVVSAPRAACCCCGSMASRKVGADWYCSEHDQFSQRTAA